MTYTNTSFFLTPLIELNYPDSIYTSSYVGTYLGDYEYDSTAVGEYMFFVYDKEVDEKLHNHFISHPRFKTQYTADEGKVTYVFDIEEEKREKVVKPFLEGKYSQVDRDYVESNFPRHHLRLAINRKVFDKDPSLKKKWEDAIGLKLPQDAEVWSKPKLEVEVYRYPVAKKQDEIPAPTA
jgi:hypothetical protein